MFIVGKVTPKDKQLLINKGYPVEVISKNWDGEIAEGDDREMIKIYWDQDVTDFLLVVSQLIRNGG